MSSTPRQMRKIMPKTPGAFGNNNQFSCVGTKEYFNLGRLHTTGKTARATKHYNIAKAEGLKYANGMKIAESEQ